MTRDDNLRQKYIDEMGREPPVDDSELAWQWAYRGTKEEREGLLARLGLKIEMGPSPQEEKLFGA